MGLAVVSMLAACGSETKPAARYDEVVARVNGEEITVNQLNERMVLIGVPAESAAGAARMWLLDLLIDEQLLMQKAIDLGLDKDPATRGAIAHARMQLLARAAIEDISGDPNAGETEARAFYLANPDLFGKRKVYRFRRFLLEDGTLNATAKAKLDSAKSAADVVAVLDASGIAYSQASELRTAESLPAEMLGQAARMVPGDILLIVEGSRSALMQLADSAAEPVSLEAAMPSIREYLADARRRKKAEGLVKNLRRKAKIEYVMQTAGAPKETALAKGGAALDESALNKPLQTRQMTTVVR